MELSNEQIAQSLISHFSQINSYKLRNETFSFEKKSAIVEVSKNLSKLPFYVTDHDYHTTETIKETIAKLFNRDIFIKAVFIDYIQLIDFRNNGDDRGNELIKITRELKKISTDLRIPIVVTSQLSKTVERRRNKRPNLNNIDYSYFLDTLMFLYRDGYYNSETEEPDIAEVIIAKHPDNKLETIELHFNNETSKFTSLKDL